MAIDLKNTIQIEQDATLIHINDTTGEYTVNNTGGFGAPNVNRNTFASALYGFYTNSNGETSEVSYSGSNIDYNAAHANNYQTKFSITYGVDGWYSFYYYLISTTPTVVNGEVFYDTGDDTIKIVILGVPTEVTDLSTLIDNTSVQQLLTEEILFSKLAIKQNQLLEILLDCECNQCVQNSCDCGTERLNYQKLKYSLAGTDYTFAANKKITAQDLIEKLTKIYL